MLFSVCRIESEYNNNPYTSLFTMEFLGVLEETSTALHFVWTIAVKLKDSHKEIAAVEKSMRRVEDVLSILKSKMQDRKSAFSKAGAKM